MTFCVNVIVVMSAQLVDTLCLAGDSLVAAVQEKATNLPEFSEVSSTGTGEVVSQARGNVTWFPRSTGSGGWQYMRGMLIRVLSAVK